MDFETIFNEAANGEILSISTDATSRDDQDVNNDLKMLSDALFPENGKIRTYCTKCKQRETFNVHAAVFSERDGKTSQSSIMFKILDGVSSRDNSYAVFFDVEGRTIQRCPLNVLKFSNNYTLVYSFRCDYDCDTDYSLVLSLVIKDNKATLYKIGQIPALHIVGGSDRAEFRPLLEDLGAYDDYMNAIKSHEEHLDAGACCYLRRVVTSMIKYYKAKSGANVPDSIKTRAKLEILEKAGVIDSDAKDLFDKVYSNLSDGDHSLTEEEDGKYYPDFINAVDLQLEEETAKREHDKKRAQILHRTSQVAQEIAEKK
jgi:hypothetical protein